MSAARSPVRPVRTRAMGGVASVLAALALLLGPGAGTAAAHDGLVATAPAADAVLETAPGEVRLEFSGAPQALGTSVTVTGPDGAPAGRGEPEVRGTTVVQPLVTGLPAGDYTVDWRIVSADGHPLSGVLAFRVSEGSAAAPAGTEAVGPTATAAAPQSSSAPVGIAVGALIGVGGLLVARQVRRPA